MTKSGVARREAAICAVARDAGLDSEALLALAGFRIEGPGCEQGSDEEGMFWYTLIRPKWSGMECGDTLPDRLAAVEGAMRALVGDDDIDWEAGTIAEDVQSQFCGKFAEIVKAAGALLHQQTTQPMLRA